MEPAWCENEARRKHEDERKEVKRRLIGEKDICLYSEDVVLQSKQRDQN